MTTTNPFFTHKDHYLAFRASWAKSVNSDDCRLNGSRHMIYNILRGRAYDKGFTPITNTNKLENGLLINPGTYYAHGVVHMLIKYAKNHVDGGDVHPELTQLLDIFDGNVTPQMIASIVLPETKAMTANYGPYRSVARHIIDGKFEDRPKTFDDIQAIYDFVTTKVA